MSLPPPHAITRKKSTTSSRVGPGSGRSSPLSHLKEQTESPQMIVCARYDVLRALAHASGVEQVTLWALPQKKYQVSFRIKNQEFEWYLSTARDKTKPRAFVNLGAAAHIAHGIAPAATMVVNMTKVPSK
ncbi:MAG TPA: hypothetical protein PKD12_07395 [Nitrospira sp.]|nr:hypothetical protein [Nitrospira sp.]